QADATIDLPALEGLRRRLPDEPPADEGTLHPADLAQRPVVQAAAQRIADEQRPRQHRRADGHAEQDGEVATPVEDEAAAQEVSQRHGIIPVSPPGERSEVGGRPPTSLRSPGDETLTR